MARKTVAIAGSFDLIHGGHIDHIRKAYGLGSWLYIITHIDEVVKRKKDYCLQTLSVRAFLLQCILDRLGGKGEVIVASDDKTTKDLTCTETLKELRPDIFAKGGDRTPDNMPQSELDLCAQYGIEIRYGVGDLLNSSSKRMEQIVAEAFCSKCPLRIDS